MARRQSRFRYRFASRTKPCLLDQVWDRLRVKHYALRTEAAYIDWIKRFILFYGKHHPAEMSAPEVEALLTHLAVDRKDTSCQGASAVPFS